MARVTSNAAEVVAELQGFVGGLGFGGRGRYRSFGEDARDVIAQGVYDRTVLAQQYPDGAPLAPLAPSTLREKRLKGYPETILVRTGLMLSGEELRGEATVTRTSLDVEYGRTELAKQEAEWATEGSRKRHRPPRRFFELDRRDEADLDLLAQESLDNQAADSGCVDA